MSFWDDRSTIRTVPSRLAPAKYLPSSLKAAAVTVLGKRNDAVVAVFALVSGLAVPKLFARWEACGRAFGKVVAGMVTWICLVPVFYLIFVPGRLILALTGKDPMGLAFPTKQPTYWGPRAPGKDAAEYRRQY